MAFCSHCLDLNELTGTPSGSETKVGGVDTYVAKGASQQGGIVIATDIFGLKIVNPKIVADQLAKQSGYSVYVPDIFPGGAIDAKDFVLPKRASEGAPSEEQTSKNFANFGEWIGKKNSPEHTFPIFKSVAEEVKKTNGGKVGGVGFCYGGKLVSLGALDGVLSAGAIYHPALLEAEEASKIKIPILLNQAELDPLFQGELQDAWNKGLQSNNLLDKRSKQYPNTVHGFGSRPDLKDAKVKEGHEEALKNTAAFFSENLA